MDPHYAVVADPRRDFVRITLAGFFGLPDVERFKIDLVQGYGQLRCKPNRHLTLCDVTGLRIQPQDVVAAFAALANDRRYMSRRLAVVTGASLARLQSRRVTERDSVAYFTDVAEAETWLFSEPATRAA